MRSQRWDTQDDVRGYAERFEIVRGSSSSDAWTSGALEPAVERGVVAGCCKGLHSMMTSHPALLMRWLPKNEHGGQRIHTPFSRDSPSAQIFGKPTQQPRCEGSLVHYRSPLFVGFFVCTAPGSVLWKQRTSVARRNLLPAGFVSFVPALKSLQVAYPDEHRSIPLQTAIVTWYTRDPSRLQKARLNANNDISLRCVALSETKQERLTSGRRLSLRFSAQRPVCFRSPSLSISLFLSQL